MAHDTRFATLPEALLRLLDTRAAPLRLQAGELLFDQGDHDERLYMLDTGTLEVCVLSAAGKRLALNQLHAGAVFGEIAVFDPGPRTARIEALSDCTLRAIRHATLLAAMRDDPGLSVALLRLAGQRMRWMAQQVEEQVFLPPAPRLAAKIRHLAGDTAEVRISQAQLADYVGVSREIVSKTLSEWRRQGLVGLSRGRISVLDAEALDRIEQVDLV